MVDTQELDDSSSSYGSEFTYSTSSTVWGPGALTGKFLKALGEKSLDFFARVIIRRRLAAIKQTLEKNPHVFCDPQTPCEWQQVNEVYDELKELCRECYTLSLRRAAANIIQDIALNTQHDSSARSKWQFLLARLQHPGGLLSVPPKTVITVDRKVSEALKSTDNKDSCDLDPKRPIEIGVTVEVTHSGGPVNDNLNRRPTLFNRRLFRSRRIMISGGNCCRNANVDAQKQPCLEHNNSRQSKKIYNWLHVPQKPPMLPSQRYTSREDPGSHLDQGIVLDSRASALEALADLHADIPSIPGEENSMSLHVHSGLILAPSVKCNRADIQRELDRARKLVHNLENDLMTHACADCATASL